MLASKKKNLKEKDTTYINKQFAHDSAEKHVSGEAVYVDDILDYPEALHCCFFCSNQAHAQIQEVDISEAQKMAGVVDIIQAKDVPAKLDIAPVFDGDPLLADKKVEFFGQPIVAVAAKDMYSARKAVQKIKVKYKSLEPILDLKEALQKKSFVLEPQLLQRGNVNLALQKAKHRLNGGGSFLFGNSNFFMCLKRMVCFFIALLKILQKFKNLYRSNRFKNVPSGCRYWEEVLVVKHFYLETLHLNGFCFL